MAQMSMRIPHRLTRQDAKVRIQGFIPGLQQRFAKKIRNVEENWDVFPHTFSFEVDAARFLPWMTVAGKLQVLEHDILIEAEVDDAAALFEGTIKKKIMDEATRLLA